MKNIEWKKAFLRGRISTRQKEIDTAEHAELTRSQQAIASYQRELHELGGSS